MLRTFCDVATINRNHTPVSNTNKSLVKMKFLYLYKLNLYICIVFSIKCTDNTFQNIEISGAFTKTSSVNLHFFNCFLKRFINKYGIRENTDPIDNQLNYFRRAILVCKISIVFFL